MVFQIADTLKMNRLSSFLKNDSPTYFVLLLNQGTPMNYYLILLFCFFSCTPLLYSQGYEPTSGSMAAAHFQDGQSALLGKDFATAIRHFRKALREQETLTVAHRMIGQCHVL